MAGNFYNWNRDLNSFNVSVYMGPSPNSYKEAVEIIDGGYGILRNAI